MAIQVPIQIFFTDVFGVTHETMDAHGAFNISLAVDVPVFVDPFLLFDSKTPALAALHDEIIAYLTYLRDRTRMGLDPALIGTLFTFKEVHQNWLGYSGRGNRGIGLGRKFAETLHGGLASVCQDFGTESVTRGSHLEKLCLIADGVGRDKISDFTTNLIKAFLAGYTQDFAMKHLLPTQRRQVVVERARFNYGLGRWMPERYELPYFAGDYVLLTPKEILTRDDTWISKAGLFAEFDDLTESLPNPALRAHINDYLSKALRNDYSQEEWSTAVAALLRRFPELYDYYIRYKENHAADAKNVSQQHVRFAERVFGMAVAGLAASLSETEFYRSQGNTYDEVLVRVKWLKHVIEDRDGYRVFYLDGKPVQREADLQVMFMLTWCGTISDANREVNNGMGPVDFAVSRGAFDKSLVEFKLASNSKLRQNLAHQTKVYERANPGARSVRVILCFTDGDYFKVRTVLKDLNLSNDPAVVVIDARRSNKISGSKAR